MIGDVPACVGIILDGNRRWAKERGLATLEGHRAGKAALKTAARFIGKRGVRHLVVYAFSTENWNREAEEVSYLLSLFQEVVQEELSELGKEGFRIRFVGQRERFSKELQDAMALVEEKTARNDALTLWVCLSYGSRAEIATAARTLQARGEEITDESLGNALWTAGMPNPDIIIRPGGEKRLSNFLLWQSAYAELFFIDAYWPDFSEKIFDGILAEFAERERRHGK
jgi:undecaprenyl diphosphate synthase